MSELLNFTRDAGGYNTFGLPFTSDTATGILTPNVETIITVPSNYPYWEAFFSYLPGAAVWVFLNQTAVVPTTTFAFGNGGELNPGVKPCMGGDTIHLITLDAADQVGIVLYKQQYAGGGGI
jgi:hypothetical protein